MSDEIEPVVDSVDSTAPVGTDEPPVGGTDAGVAEEAPFFTWKGQDGTETVFRKPAELADHLSHSSMRKADYDAALEKVNARAKYIEERESAYQKQQKELDSSDGVRFDKFLKENPQVRAKIKAEMAAMKKAGMSPDLIKQLVEEQTKPLFDKDAERDKADQERQQEAARQSAFKRLREIDPTADEKAIAAEMTRLQEIPPQDLAYAIMDLLHHSIKGRSTPAELERRAAAAAQRRGNPSVVSTPGVKPTVADPVKMTAQQRRDAAANLLPG